MYGLAARGGRAGRKIAEDPPPPPHPTPREDPPTPPHPSPPRLMSAAPVAPMVALAPTNAAEPLVVASFDSSTEVVVSADDQTSQRRRGSWSSRLCECFSDWPTCLVVHCFPCCTTGVLCGRFLAVPSKPGSISSDVKFGRLVCLLMFLIVVVMYVCAAVYFHKWASAVFQVAQDPVLYPGILVTYGLLDLQLLLNVHSGMMILSWAFFAIMFFVTCQSRAQLRRRDNIPAGKCSGAEVNR